MTVATFGEWDSHIEGGADIKLIAVVPSGLTVERRNDLSGGKSAATRSKENETPRSDSTAISENDWWGRTSLADGWSELSTVPDRRQTAYVRFKREK